MSATHIDHTMVPYVRKSFRKHYFDGLHYISSGESDFLESHYLSAYIGWVRNNPVEETSIEDEYYKEVESAYEYAIDMTTKEVYQAVEGMYHNLNTLQSRSGNQLE